MSVRVDVGSGVNYRLYTEVGADGPTGMIVEGPAGVHCKHPGTDGGADSEGRCAGGVSFTNSTIAARQGRPMWTVSTLDPLTLSPSIRCSCDLDHPGEGRHGFITNGRWVNAGGMVT